jgi:hypothetical protein
MNFEQRCALAQNCLPQSEYRNWLTALHNEMLARIADLESEVSRFRADAMNEKSARQTMEAQRGPLTDAQWLEYLLKHASCSVLSVAAFQSNSIQSAGRWALRHDANELRKLAESAHGITKDTQ